MADILNIIDLDCEQDIVYTGASDCPFNLGIPKFMVAIPRGKTYSQAEWDDIINVLALAATTNPYSTRALPIGLIIDFTDNSTEASPETTGLGFNIATGEGTIGWTIRLGVDLGGFIQLKNISGKQATYDFLLGFAEGIVGTTRRNVTTGDMEYGGIRFSFLETLLPKFATRTTGENYSMSVQIADSTQITKRLAFKRLETEDFTDIPGIQEVTMTGTVNVSPAGSVDIDPRVKFGGKSLVEIYGVTVADVDLFVATNTLTGADIDLTGATIVNGKIRLQADILDTDYPAASAQWTITPAPIADFVTAGIVGYEISNSVTVTRP